MGQPNSSEGSSAAEADGVTALPHLESYLGRCWLLAATAQSFSPSRWFPLCDRTTRSCAAACRARPCFSLAQARPMPSRNRLKDPVLVNLPRLVLPLGVALTTYTKLSVSTFTISELSGKTTVPVGGAHIDVSFLSSPPPGEAATGGAGGPAPRAFLCIVSLWVLDAEMQPTQYASAPYTRHAVKAPPTTNEERRAYGEGCITAVRYGGILAVSTNDAGFGSAVAARVRGVGGSPISSVTVLPDREPSSAKASDPLPALVADAKDASGTFTVGAAASPKQCADWAMAVCARPDTWTPTALFLQRYEAIGSSILRA